jgi:TP901 family phage tail tape measure protein
MARQPETKVTFRVFNEEFNKAMGEMQKESTQLRKEFKLQSLQMKDTATEVEKLENKLTYLGKEQDIVRRRIELTEKQLGKAKQTFGENSNEANKLANRLLDLRISEQKLENDINQTRTAISKQSQEMTEASQDAGKYKKSLDEIGQSASELGDKLSTGVTLPIAGAGAAGVKSALDIDGAVRLLIGALGATGDEAKQLEKDLRTVWEDGFGDNPEEVARSIMLVRQNIKGINDGEELQKITKNMLLLAEVTESDMGEATRGVNQLMHNFGLTADEALDLFKKGHEEGLNYSNEMFDNVAEYAPLFKQMGFSAQEYFTILANGVQNGAYNLDYINDLMKEFNIRVQDGSDTTADAFKEMSKETQKLFKAYEKGEATTKDLFEAVIPELESMEDQVKANQIAVDLFGTKWEDMGAETVYALDDVNDALQDVEGSMDEYAKIQEESFGQQARKTFRELGKAVEPFGEELLEMLQDVTPNIEKMVDWFVNLDDETKDLIATMGMLTAAAGPSVKIFGFMSNTLGSLTKKTSDLNEKFGKLGLLGTFGRLFGKAGPIGLGVVAVTGLVSVIGGLIGKKEKLKEVSLDNYNSMMNEYTANQEMITQLDELRKKSNLTNDEFGRYLDLHTRLREESDPGVISNIKDEMAALEKKSRLSNDELNEMIELNGHIVETIPGATGVITDQGNKIADTTGELEKYNQELLNMATIELENQFFNAYENQNKLLKDQEDQRKRLEQARKNELLVEELLNNYSEENLEKVKQQLEEERRLIQDKIISNQYEGIELELLQEQAKTNDQIRMAIGQGKQELKNQWVQLKQNTNEQEQQLTNTEQQLAQFDVITQKLQEHYLTSNGISKEKAYQAIQDGNQIAAIDEQIGLLQNKKSELRKAHENGQLLTEDYEQQVREIDKQISGLESSKGKITDLINLAKDYNEELKIDIEKNVYLKVNEDKTFARLGDPITKTVNIVTSGGGRHLAMYAKGTTFHPGGPALVGEEGPELIREGNKWSLATLGIYNLKRGADVFTAEQTEKILKGLMRLPAYAGGAGVGSTRLTTGLDTISANLVNRIQNIQNNLSISIEASDVLIDGQYAGKVLWKPVKENIDRFEDIERRFKG